MDSEKGTRVFARGHNVPLGFWRTKKSVVGTGLKRRFEFSLGDDQAFS